MLCFNNFKSTQQQQWFVGTKKSMTDTQVQNVQCCGFKNPNEGTLNDSCCLSWRAATPALVPPRRAGRGICCWPGWHWFPPKMDNDCDDKEFLLFSHSCFYYLHNRKNMVIIIILTATCTTTHTLWFHSACLVLRGSMTWMQPVKWRGSEDQIWSLLYQATKPTDTIDAFRAASFFCFFRFELKPSRGTNLPEPCSVVVLSSVNEAEAEATQSSAWGPVIVFFFLLWP